MGASRRSTIILVLGIPWLLGGSAVEAKLVLVPNARKIVVENQAQHRHEDTAEAAVGRIRVNGLRPVKTDG
jgi:hypothetical protein